jgi:hypothetical protein
MKTSSPQTSQQSSTDRPLSGGERQSASTRPRQNSEAQQPQEGQRQQASNQRPSEASEQNAEERQQIRETVTHEEIARRAHELWEQDGCPEGRHEQHWTEAEKQLRGSSFGSDARDVAQTIKASAERRANTPVRN